MERKEFKLEDFTPRDMFIEASAGTGKTYSIIEMVKRMLAAEGASANGRETLRLDQIVIVTYTEKAAGELKSRIFNAVGGNADVFTIHSFCQSMLTAFPFECGHSLGIEMVKDGAFDAFLDRMIADEFSKEEAFARFLEFDDGFAEKARKVLRNGVKLFDEGVVCLDDPRAGAQEDAKKNAVSIAERECLNSKIAIVREKWKDEKRRRGIWSFDDMLDEMRAAVKRFGGSNPFTDVIRKRYKVAIIDEFQDTSMRQWEIFKTLFLDSGENHLIVVGDPKQSIYSFQGADVRAYQRAVQDPGFGEDAGFNLSRNYRSSAGMINSFNAIFGGADGAKGFFDPKGGKDDSGIRYEHSSIGRERAGAVSQFDGKEIEPVWLVRAEDGTGADGGASDSVFASWAAARIAEFCRIGENGKTRLQIPCETESNGKVTMRNVRYGDFAALARKRNELDCLASELGKIGIPFTRYKDKALFKDDEARHWLSLLRAIDAPDFAQGNRRVLVSALLTVFFMGTAEENSGASAFGFMKMADEDRDCLSFFRMEWREWFAKWKYLAARRRWAALFESIFEDTRVEERLKCGRARAGYSCQLGKMRQLANYMTERLYKDNLELSDAIDLLERIANADKNEEVGKDEDIVEKESDRDAVQLMTIHASKGLQFPIVISVAGSKGGYMGVSSSFGGDHDQLIYSYYKENGDGEDRLVLGFDKTKAKQRQAEEIRRLLYVDFTRAMHLLILNLFKEKKGEEIEGYEGMNSILNGFASGNGNLCKNICLALGSQSEPPPSSDAPEPPDELRAPAYREPDRLSLIMRLPELADRRESYSSVSHSGPDEVANRILVSSKDPRGMDASDVIASRRAGFISPYDAGKARESLERLERFPKGALIGTAVHRMFELIDFRSAGLDGGFDAFRSNAQVKSIVESSLRANGFGAHLRYDCLFDSCLGILYDVLNADFPFRVMSSEGDEGPFSLSRVPIGDKFTEVRFDQCAWSDRSETQTGADYWTGSIDLVFRRRIAGKDVYKIVDWKTDTLESPEAYADQESMERWCDERYSIQRALYSYALIKHLSECGVAGGNMEKIFEENFAGISYCFVKGCCEGTRNGIVTREWSSFGELEKAYKDLLA